MGRSAGKSLVTHAIVDRHPPSRKGHQHPSREKLSYRRTSCTKAGEDPKTRILIPQKRPSPFNQLIHLLKTFWPACPTTLPWLPLSQHSTNPSHSIIYHTAAYDNVHTRLFHYPLRISTINYLQFPYSIASHKSSFKNHLIIFRQLYLK